MKVFWGVVWWLVGWLNIFIQTVDKESGLVAVALVLVVAVVSHFSNLQSSQIESNRLYLSFEFERQQVYNLIILAIYYENDLFYLL